MPTGNKERLTLETNLLKSFSVTFVSWSLQLKQARYYDRNILHY